MRRKSIEAKGCQLLFLPGYSSDFSSIEEAFSKLKAYLRQVGVRHSSPARPEVLSLSSLLISSLWALVL
jgi:transposase